MIRCKRCNLPETHETITFNDEGICNICLNYDLKQLIDWKEKKLVLDKMVEWAYNPNGSYDVIIPVSGGKDSCFTLLYMKENYPKARLLAARFDHTFMREVANKNLNRALDTLGIDLACHRPPLSVVRETARETLLQKGDFCWFCHTGIFSYPMRLACQLGVRLVVWGEASAEYTAYYSHSDEEEVDEKRFNRFINLGISADDMEMRCNMPKGTLDSFRFPPRSDFPKDGLRSICLGSYICWNTKEQVEEIKEKLGWELSTVKGIAKTQTYDKTECKMQYTRDWLKYQKRGYARNTHLAAIDQREGRWAPDGELLDKIHYREFPKELSELTQLSEEEITQTIEKLKVPPWKN